MLNLYYYPLPNLSNPHRFLIRLMYRKVIEGLILNSSFRGSYKKDIYLNQKNHSLLAY